MAASLALLQIVFRRSVDANFVEGLSTDAESNVSRIPSAFVQIHSFQLRFTFCSGAWGVSGYGMTPETCSCLTVVSEKRDGWAVLGLQKWTVRGERRGKDCPGVGPRCSWLGSETPVA